jgi:hypothetical protein
MISSKATSTEWASDVPSGFCRSCLPCSFSFFSGTAPSLSTLLGLFAEAESSEATSATRYDLPERIFAATRVVAELKFADI